MCDKPSWLLKDQTDLCVCKCRRARLGLSPSASPYFLLLLSLGPQLSCLVNSKKFTEIFAECINWNVRTPRPWTFLAVFLTFTSYVVNPMRSLWSVLRIWPSSSSMAILSLSRAISVTSCLHFWFWPVSSVMYAQFKYHNDSCRESLNPCVVLRILQWWNHTEVTWLMIQVPKHLPHLHLVSQLIYFPHPCSFSSTYKCLLQFL